MKYQTQQQPQNTTAATLSYGHVLGGGGDGFADGNRNYANIGSGYYYNSPGQQQPRNSCNNGMESPRVSGLGDDGQNSNGGGTIPFNFNFNTANVGQSSSCGGFWYNQQQQPWPTSLDHQRLPYGNSNIVQMNQNRWSKSRILNGVAFPVFDN